MYFNLGTRNHSCALTFRDLLSTSLFSPSCDAYSWYHHHDTSSH